MQHRCRAGISEPTHEDYSCTAGGPLEDAHRALSAYGIVGAPRNNSCTAGGWLGCTGGKKTVTEMFNKHPMFTMDFFDASG
eukprot:10252789-Karenia_brevis.AAC.1